MPSASKKRKAKVRNASRMGAKKVVKKSRRRLGSKKKQVTIEHQLRKVKGCPHCDHKQFSFYGLMEGRPGYQCDKCGHKWSDDAQRTYWTSMELRAKILGKPKGDTQGE